MLKFVFFGLGEIEGNFGVFRVDFNEFGLLLRVVSRKTTPKSTHYFGNAKFLIVKNLYKFLK